MDITDLKRTETQRDEAQMIEDLLDMSRIISGKVRLDVQRRDLASIVQSSVETARPAADAKSIRLQTVTDPLDGIVVSGDVNRLQQVLWNLNAQERYIRRSCLRHRHAG